ncbi:hypothetical protein LTR02_009996 [Friedmanniomyces endolithicus]|nr:hypothetical protein LTR02_009996 [Friedmanniomyces endolithicus]
MPTLARVCVPSYERSPSTATDSSSASRAPRKLLPVPRTYGREPLSIKPSEDSSINARIVGRVVEIRGGRYSLKIGNEELENVGVEEILDYVSADHLEDYENQQFEEEREARRVAEEAYEKSQRRKAKKAELKDNARHHDSTGEPGGDERAAEVSKGRHGRARPTYKHLYLKPEKRRRRKRDPLTNELMPLSDE